MIATSMLAIPPPYAALLTLLAVALLTGAFARVILRKERSPRDPKTGWGVHRLRTSRLTCQRCRAQYEDGDYVWQDPEGRLICHVACESPGSLPTSDALNVPFDSVSGPLAAGRAVAALAPPPARHNWSNPARGCGYAHLQPGDKPRCTCPKGSDSTGARTTDFERTVVSKPGAVIHAVAVRPPERIERQLRTGVQRIGSDEE